MTAAFGVVMALAGAFTEDFAAAMVVAVDVAVAVAVAVVVFLTVDVDEVVFWLWRLPWLLKLTRSWLKLPRAKRGLRNNHGSRLGAPQSRTPRM